MVALKTSSAHARVPLTGRSAADGGFLLAPFSSGSIFLNSRGGSIIWNSIEDPFIALPDFLQSGCH